MTLTAIKAMFVPGSAWTCRRVGQALAINGNTGRSVMPAQDVTETRVVKSAKSELVWNVTRGLQVQKLHTCWPKAHEVLEAAPGVLRFRYCNGVEVTFTKNN